MQDQQQEALERATAAAAAGDPVAMMEALAESRIIDGLVRQMQKKWPGLDSEECYSAVAEAVDSLYATVQSGRKVYNIGGYLWKASDRCAFDAHESKMRLVPIDSEEVVLLQGHKPSALEQVAVRETADAEDSDRRSKGITLLRRLVPRCGGPNIQMVLNYILDALQLGLPDVPNREIEEATGLSSQAVRTARSRGLQRLERHAREWAQGAAALAETGVLEEVNSSGDE